MRLVNTAAATWIPSARRSSSACEEISIAHAASPASSISRNVRWRSIASGVVRTTARSSPPTTDLTVPSRPEEHARALEQRAREERGRRLAVGAGDPGDAQRRRRVAVEARRGARHRGAHVRRPRTSGTPRPSGRCTTSATAPRATASGAKSCPSRVKPGTQKNSVPGADEPVVERQARDDHVGAVPEQLAERHAAGSLRVRPAASNACPCRTRRTLVDADGAADRDLHLHVERDGRDVADLLELECPSSAPCR